MPSKKKAKKKSRVPNTKRKAQRAKRAVIKHAAPKAALQYIAWHTLPLEDLNPLLQRQFVVGQEIMLARVLLKKGCIVPLHSHHNEQLTYILDGALKFWIDGKEIVDSQRTTDVHSGRCAEVLDRRQGDRRQCRRDALHPGEHAAQG